MPRVLVGRRRRDEREAAKQAVVSLPELGAVRDPPIEPGKLVDAQRGVKVGEDELRPGLGRHVVEKPGVRIAATGSRAEAMQGQAHDIVLDGPLRYGTSPTI